MSDYELMVITAVPAGEEVAEVKSIIEPVVAKYKGKIMAGDEWGERQLTYPIKKHERGIYGVFAVALEPGSVKKIKQMLSLDKRVIRFLLMKNA